MGDSATESTAVTEGLGVQLLFALGVLGGLLLTTKYTNETKVLLRVLCVVCSVPRWKQFLAPGVKRSNVKRGRRNPRVRLNGQVPCSPCTLVFARHAA